MTLMISPAVEPLLKSHLFPTYVEQMQRYFDAEREKREAYYDWLKPNIKAEFINGEVLMQSPAKDRHTIASKNLSSLLDAYVEKHNLGFVGVETALVSLTRNDYLPDICFFLPNKADFFTLDQMHHPGPDFVVEILSPSTERTDRGVKANDYADHDVAEYWLVDPVNEIVEQFFLENGRFELHLKVKTGRLESRRVVDGFKIEVEAVFSGSRRNAELLRILSE